MDNLQRAYNIIKAAAIRGDQAPSDDTIGDRLGLTRGAASRVVSILKKQGRIKVINKRGCQRQIQIDGMVTKHVKRSMTTKAISPHPPGIDPEVYRWMKIAMRRYIPVIAEMNSEGQRTGNFVVGNKVVTRTRLKALAAEIANKKAA